MYIGTFQLANLLVSNTEYKRRSIERARASPRLRPRRGSTPERVAAKCRVIPNLSDETIRSLYRLTHPLV